MQENTPSLAFVDHIFHAKTGSSDFLRDIIAEEFSLTDYWIDPYSDRRVMEIPTETLNQYEYLHFFQRITPALKLKYIKTKMSFSIMYDSFNRDYFYWQILSYLPIKILCFSQKVYDHAKRFGVNALRIQRYMNPEKFRLPIPQTGRHIFFWYRGSIRFEDIKKVLDPHQIDSFIYLEKPDPKYKSEMISQEDIRRFKMTIVKGDFKESKDEYRGLMTKGNIFISPRKTEGIGMSFLEALASDQIVIAYDDSTMNEYIVDNVDGYLFTEKSKKIDLSNAEEVRKKSIDKARRGYEKWKQEMKIIPQFLSAPYIPAKTNPLIRKIFEIIYALKLKLFTLRNG